MENKQTCRFCEDPNSILTRETCCTGCSKIPNPYQPERLNPEDAKKYAGVLPDKLSWCAPTTSVCDSLNTTNK